ncbi:HD family phosphohydrolase [Ectobacillus sp. JY-23]|uniref:HD family phosphohydrolase n=1 Tax=Ectobacillus sp. JY-23 TaxID=2933872 RepID=UPI001FF45447|nr:HD family phosphohydrolase [Ectobacillus sp. JY-23]UOY94049.1 HD family phosphohydrolase [Ectobacillus sp. JY-23]
MLKTNKVSLFVRRLSHINFIIMSLYAILGFILFAALASNVKPDELDVKLLSIAKKTIHSPITIEDKATTEKKKREAAQKVEDQYTYRTEYKQNRIDIVNSVFDIVKEVGDDSKGSATTVPVSEQVDMLKKKLPSDIIKSVTEQGLLAMLSATPEQLAAAREFSVTAVNNVMSRQIKINEVSEARTRLSNELRYASVTGALKDAIISLGQYAVIPNYFYDPIATKERKQLEMSTVDPVYILQGQVIVKEGDTIKREVYEQLKLVGLADNQTALQPFLGLIMLISLLLFFVHKQFTRFLNHKHEDKPYLVAYIIIVAMTIFLMKIISLFQQVEYAGLSYMVPVAMGTMLIKLMIGERFVFVTSMIFSISGSIMFNEGVTSAFNYSVGTYILLSALSANIFLKEKNLRSMILQAGIFISLFNVLVISALLLLRNGQFSWFEVGLHLMMAAASGLLSSVLVMGLLPYLESGLGIVSTMKLMELGSPNHNLLRKILLETPGTYHHSIMVANLSEAACEAIGANGLVARVGAYYHDIGKTVRPHFFIENQMGAANPHDELSPEVSRDIIISHVTEGVKLLREHKIPKEIVDIAAEHHGTTLLKYFYHKAVQSGDKEYTEEMFRYPGPKARSKESAIVGIADSVEAAVRSLNAPTPEQIEKLVKGIVSDRLRDGQFSQCNLTFQELEIVTKTLCETLNGIFHSRITYPD